MRRRGVRERCGQPGHVGLPGGRMRQVGVGREPGQLLVACTVLHRHGRAATTEPLDVQQAERWLGNQPAQHAWHGARDQPQASQPPGFRRGGAAGRPRRGAPCPRLGLPALGAGPTPPLRGHVRLPGTGVHPVGGRRRVRPGPAGTPSVCGRPCRRRRRRRGQRHGDHLRPVGARARLGVPRAVGRAGGARRRRRLGAGAGRDAGRVGAGRIRRQKRQAPVGIGVLRAMAWAMSGWTRSAVRA